jgi:hypothetical protein
VLAAGAALAAGIVWGVLVVMGLQRAMHGSPFASGYGDLNLLFTTSNIVPNLQRYPRWLVEVHTPVIAGAIAAPFILAAPVRRYAAWLLTFAAATFVCYIAYVVYDAWWYLRFVLPAILPLLALSSAVVCSVLTRVPAAGRVVAFVAILVALPMFFVHTATIPTIGSASRAADSSIRSASLR